MQTTPMDRAYIDEYDVIQRYIRRSLSEQELQQFEIHMLLNPSIIEEIEQQRMLNQIFREELPKATRAQAAATPRYKLLGLRHVVPAAACLVLALFVGLNMQGPTPVVPTLDTVVLQDLRGASDSFEIQVPAAVRDSASMVLPLKIDVGPQLEPVTNYRVQLLSVEGATIAEQDGRSAGVDGWLETTFTLPGTTPASYRVQVTELPGGDSRSYSLSLQ